MAVLRVVKHERNRRFAIRTATAEEGREMQAAVGDYGLGVGQLGGIASSAWGDRCAQLLAVR